MSLDRRRLIAASEGLLSAAVLGRSWEHALDAFAEAAHSHSACLWSSRAGRPSYLGNRSFIEQGAANINRPGDPPYTDDVLISAKDDCGFVTTLSPLKRSRLERLPFYQDVLARIGFNHFAGYGLDPDDGSLMRLAFWRDAGNRAFDEEEIAAMNVTVFNVEHAVLFARQKHELLSRQQALPYAARGEATFALEASGRAAPISGSAEAAMSGMPLFLKRGRLVALFPEQARRLDRVVKAAVQRGGQPASTVLTSIAGDRYQLLVLPLYGEAMDVFCGTRAIATVLKIQDAGRIDPRTLLITQTGFDLTPREAEVAALAASGLPPAAISSRLGIGQGTVRNHVKAVFRKVGVHSQAELAALLGRYH